MAELRAVRALYLIFTDLQALTGPQKAAVWNDISAGSPAKYLLDTGPNAGNIGTLYWAALFSGATGNALLAAQLLLVANYCQDNPSYLVNPAFSPLINISGAA